MRRHSQTEFIGLNKRLCRACWKCIGTCREGVLGKIEVLWHKHVKIINPGKCKGCLKCVSSCPGNALYPVKS